MAITRRAALVETDRQQAMAHDEVARQQADRGRVGRDGAQVDHVEVHLSGQGIDQVFLGDQTRGDEDLAETSASGLLMLQGVVDLTLRDDPAVDEQGAQLEATGAAPVTAGDRPLELVAQVFDAEGLGDVLGDAETVGLLEGLEIVGGREHDDGRRVQAGGRAHEPEDVEAPDALQVDVEQERVGW